MALDQVIGEVRRDGETRAQTVLTTARAEAEAIIAAAKAQAKAAEKARLDAAARDGQAVQSQGASRAESEARKAVLTAEAAIREDLKARVLAAFSALPAKTREAHLTKLLATAAKVIPSGRSWGAAMDAAFLAKQKPYTHVGDLPITGGLVVESEDGQVRLDLTYETILDGKWRDVLKAEAALFT